MLFEDYELDMMRDALAGYGSGTLYGDVIAEQICDKLRNLQPQSYNKRYTFRSTDWLSEASRKRARKGRSVPLDEGLI